MILNKKRIAETIKNLICVVVFIFSQQLFPQADFTIIGLPDTQWYSENDGNGAISTFIAQTEWIVASKNSLNIVYVAHLGDCVQNGDTGDDFLPSVTPTNVQEWDNASSAMYLLEDSFTTGLTDGIPYGIAVGNHDQSEWGNPNGTTTLYNTYFGSAHFNGRSYYGGHYGSNNDNHYDLFTVGTLKFVVVYIEHRAHADDPLAVDWADDILAAFPERHGIIVHHKLLGSSGTFSSSGTYIYGRTRDNANLFLMLAGHVSGEERWTESRGGDSTDVVTLMSDYQALANGGDGWLRIMKFSPVDKKIYVTTYSPTLNSFQMDSDSEFELNYNFTNPPLPVELAYIAGVVDGNRIKLRWRTETEVNNYGFDIERTKVNADWLTIGFVEGHGNSNSPKLYNFIDSDINQSGTYYYRLKQIDNDGTYEYSDVVSVEVGVPKIFYLSQNYPNPFNPETRIDFSLPEKQLVRLRIYNTLGELVKELVNEQREAGSYSVTFDASNLPSGVYIYSLQTSEFAENKKMTYLK
ncbi:MAG: T9SS type A sorting domain-containing protein [Ignavibacteria bacterium]|nr:T9SS type A sorting domain-containing protein [Ignavibacteria bacterium]